MGLSASQGRMLLLTARKNDLEFRAQQISQKRLVLSQQLEAISMDYENATSNRQMKIDLYAIDGTDESKVTRSSNLTYSLLVSGSIGNAASGIQASEKVGTDSLTHKSNNAFRLVDADGAIVVADKSEIPGNETIVTKKAASKNEKDGTYSVGTYDSNTGETFTQKYAVPPSPAEPAKAGAEPAKPGAEPADKESQAHKDWEAKKTAHDAWQATKDAHDDWAASCALKNIIGQSANKNFQIKDGIVNIDGTYYNIATGKQVKDNIPDFTGAESCIFKNSVDDIPKSDVTSTPDVNIKEGADGKFTVQKADVSIVRYVVDKTLNTGSTDQYGTAGDGPNYLQDCLRNGKYLIQKFSPATKEQDARWNSLSWDATTNISDSYYTEDDDRAKAKYDRMQTQIQNQDKKLELELDNIETQRSAVTTEEESVKKVIDDNVEGSFKCFA